MALNVRARNVDNGSVIATHVAIASRPMDRAIACSRTRASTTAKRC